jgi:hypothetical protein
LISVWEEQQSDCITHTILIFLATSFGHATPEIIEEFLVFADALDVNRVAAAKAGSYTCAGAVR